MLIPSPRPFFLRASVVVIAFASGAATPTPAADRASLRVTIDGFRNDKGRLLCAIYTPNENFLHLTQPSHYRLESIHDTTGGLTSRCEFSGLAPGAYAVSVLHDENGNKEMDFNFLGLPVEGYGASNNQLPVLSAPTFEDSKLELKPGLVEIEIRLRYL